MKPTECTPTHCTQADIAQIFRWHSPRTCPARESVVTAEDIAAAVAKLADRGRFTVDELLAIDLPVDRDHITAAAWALVEDGTLTYKANAEFVRNTH